MPGSDCRTVDLMRSHLNDLVYSSVSVEGIGATFAQTEEVLARGSAEGVSSEDVDKIVCIKRGLELLFDSHTEPLTWEVLSRYNAVVGEGNVFCAGSMRGPGAVRVGDYIPPAVSVADFYRILDTALDCSYSIEEAACTLNLLLCRAQFFHDGNKRTAALASNHLLAHMDAGSILIVREDDRDDYLDLLVSFYEGSISLTDAAWDMQEGYVLSAADDIDLARDESPSRGGRQRGPGHR